MIAAWNESSCRVLTVLGVISVQWEEVETHHPTLFRSLVSGRLVCACYGCVYESILYGCWVEILVWLRVTIPSLHTAVGSVLVPKSTLWSCTAKKTVCKSLLTNQLMHHIARKWLLDVLAFVLYCAVQYIWLFCSSKKFFNGDKKNPKPTVTLGQGIFCWKKYSVSM